MRIINLKGDNSMANEKSMMFWNPPVIIVQDICTRDRPTVFDLTHTYSVKVISKEGEEYTITKNYEGSLFDYNIGGGIFGEKAINMHSVWNKVRNIQEVFLTIASGEEYVNILIGNKDKPENCAYVRISVAEVKTSSDTPDQT